ncbi:hypothetical protein [Vibrio quintilis]|uniref:hypothetical protein n=1 Tax=Vibrio quintilis TaxID=1117707 RepID=UPI0011610B59|nr:hypothetical protein [Vibrio quintilis]
MSRGAFQNGTDHRIRKYAPNPHQTRLFCQRLEFFYFLRQIRQLFDGDFVVPGIADIDISMFNAVEAATVELVIRREQAGKAFILLGAGEQVS